jgi:hypothetical protein
MSKKIFINNINTYVSQAIIEELTKGTQGEDEEEEMAEEDFPMIFGTYIDKDSSERPQGVKIQKMLKVSFTYFCNDLDLSYRDPNLCWP